MAVAVGCDPAPEPPAPTGSAPSTAETAASTGSAPSTAETVAPMEAVAPADFADFTSPTATVAIHVSQATDSGWAKLASDPSMEGLPYSDTRGWKYWHIYGFLMEQLRSDGTPFAVVSDADVADGRLYVTDGDIAADVAAGRTPRKRGAPKYAVVFSLANTCASGAVASGIDGFVMAGGHAIVGSTSWTRDRSCRVRKLPPFKTDGSSTPQVLVTAENEFPGYPPSATVDSDPNNLWVNAMTDKLETWIQYRFDLPSLLLPPIRRVAILHSTYEERGYGYGYRIADYQVQVSDDPQCQPGTFVTVGQLRGNDISREYQTVSFSPRRAQCVRIVALSSYERRPYLDVDVTQWVGLAGFQAFDINDEALIRDADVAGDPWRPMGLRPLQIDECFDSILRADKDFKDPLVSHLVPDFRFRGYRLGTSQMTSGYDQRRHWGQAVALAPESGNDAAAKLALDVADPSGICASNHPTKPIFAKRARGKGRFIYSASFNSLAGWSAHSSASYVYGVYRHAIEEAHRSTGLPLVRLGAWPWPHVAGFMTRHDHAGHFGFDGIHGTPDDLEPAKIELYKDVASKTLRDYPVKGGYFLLNVLREDKDKVNALPDGSGKCADDKTYACNEAIKDTLRELFEFYHGEIGTHSTESSTFDARYWNFPTEYDKLRLYIGGAANPAIYVSHGGFAHFDSDSSYVGVQTMVDAGVVAKGEDAFGAHPHFALRISNGSITRYGNAARWPIIDIPATGYAIPATTPGQHFAGLGVIAHEIQHKLEVCCTPSSSCSCMDDAVDLVYGLGGIINVYDHVADTTAEKFKAYIDYAQGRPFVYTTSTRDIVNWWKLRDGIRISRTFTRNDGGYLVGVDVAGTSQDLLSIEVDVPSVPLTVSVNSQTIPPCPSLTTGTGLRAWLESQAVKSGCYVRDGVNKRIRVRARAPSSVAVRWR